MVISVGGGLKTQIQILDKPFCMLVSLEKVWIHFHPVKDRLGSLTFGKATSLQEGKLWIQTSCKVSRVSDHSRGWPEGSFFICYNTKVLRRALLFSLDCSTILDLCLIMLSVKQGGITYNFLSLWYDSSHWQTLYPLVPLKIDFVTFCLW